jgi:quercetin dioxygenase-like cupin family protein
MRATVFDLQDDRVTRTVIASPKWEPFLEYESEPLQGVSLFELKAVMNAELQMVAIAAGGHFAMHTSPDVAFCQVVKGRGTLSLPDEEVVYIAPELYVFLPGSLHEWKDVLEDTLLTVCLVKQG